MGPCCGAGAALRDCVVGQELPYGAVLWGCAVGLGLHYAMELCYAMGLPYGAVL